MNLTAELTQRENEVAEVMAFTKSKDDAADRLCIAPGTLSAHTFRIYEKLEINSKAELVIWWFVKHFKIDTTKLPMFCVAMLIQVMVILPDDKFVTARRYRTDAEIFVRYKTTGNK